MPPTQDKLILITTIQPDTNEKDVSEVLRCADDVKKTLLKKGFYVQTIHIKKEDFYHLSNLEKKIKTINPKCIFNLFEGFKTDSKTEARFAKILETTGIPFTGNNSTTLEICLNKNKVKDILGKNNIPVPKGVFIKDIHELNPNLFNPPVFIKPCFEDASIGIEEDSLVTKPQYIYKTAARKLKHFPQGIIIEEFIPQEEYNVCFLGHFPYKLLGTAILDYRQHSNFEPFLTYNSKWEETSRAFKTLTPSCGENIANDLKQQLLTLSATAGKLLGCQSYFRVDLRRREKQLFILDVNPNPDINTDSGFMRQAGHAGFHYDDIIEQILTFAINHGA